MRYEEFLEFIGHNPATYKHDVVEHNKKFGIDLSEDYVEWLFKAKYAVYNQAINPVPWQKAPHIMTVIGDQEFKCKICRVDFKTQKDSNGKVFYVDGCTCTPSCNRIIGILCRDCHARVDFARNFHELSERMFISYLESSMPCTGSDVIG